MTKNFKEEDTFRKLRQNPDIRSVQIEINKCLSTNEMHSVLDKHGYEFSEYVTKLKEHLKHEWSLALRK